MNVILHPKYGLNPTMNACIICGESTGEIVLLGKSFKGEAPVKMVTKIEPCGECRKKHLKDGVMLVEAEEEYIKERKDKTPIPTGRIIILKDNAFSKLFNTEIPKSKIAFANIEVFEQIKTGYEKAGNIKTTNN